MCIIFTKLAWKLHLSNTWVQVRTIFKISVDKSFPMNTCMCIIVAKYKNLMRYVSYWGIVYPSYLGNHFALFLNLRRKITQVSHISRSQVLHHCLSQLALPVRRKWIKCHESGTHDFTLFRNIASSSSYSHGNACAMLTRKFWEIGKNWKGKKSIWYVDLDMFQSKSLMRENTASTRFWMKEDKLNSMQKMCYGEKILCFIGLQKELPKRKMFIATKINRWSHNSSVLLKIWLASDCRRYTLINEPWFLSVTFPPWRFVFLYSISDYSKHRRKAWKHHS